MTSAWPARAGDAEPTFAAGDVQADLDAIWFTLHEVSPEPFRASDPKAMEALYRRTRARITSPLAVRQAWLAIAPVLGALNDGHVALGFPGELNKAAFRFPLSFAVSQSGDGLLVAGDRTQAVAKGSRVIAIEGAPAAGLLLTTMLACGGQTRALQRSRVTGSGAWTAVAMFGDKPAYRLRWRDPEGIEHEAPVGGAPIASARRPSEPYSFRWASERVGLIDYRRCEDLPRFRAFLDDAFAQLRSAHAAALIIDIRRNSGGNSDLNDLLWSYAQARPFKQFGATIVRSSGLLKGAYGRDKYVHIYGERAWDAPNGDVLRSGAGPEDGLVRPGPLPVRFTGPVYLLISPATFSSGMSCALAAKDYGLATLVGEETGEPASGTGELYEFVTPHLHFPAYLTTKVFLSPKAHPATQGVVPDVPITNTEIRTTSPSADAVLERTLAMIRARKGDQPASSR